MPTNKTMIGSLNSALYSTDIIYARQNRKNVIPNKNIFRCYSVYRLYKNCRVCVRTISHFIGYLECNMKRY